MGITSPCLGLHIPHSKSVHPCWGGVRANGAWVGIWGFRVKGLGVLTPRPPAQTCLPIPKPPTTDFLGSRFFQGALTKPNYGKKTSLATPTLARSGQNPSLAKMTRISVLMFWATITGLTLDLRAQTPLPPDPPLPPDRPHPTPTRTPTRTNPIRTGLDRDRPDATTPSRPWKRNLAKLGVGQSW